MLKYKNRLTPTIHTLQKLLTFYKNKKIKVSSNLVPLSRYSAFWVVKSSQLNKPSFKTLFSTHYSLPLKKWTMFNFKSFIKPELRKKSLTPIIKTFLSKKVAVLPSQSYLTSSPLIDNSLLSTSLPLIGKPFNFQNSYFFSARVTTREKQKFSLRPFFLKTVWKTYLLEALKHRLAPLSNPSLSTSLNPKVLLSEPFGNPIPSNGTLFLKPYLFTNNTEKKPGTKTFTSIVLKTLFPFFKNTSKKFVKQRFTWSESKLNTYSNPKQKIIVLRNFLISSKSLKINSPLLDYQIVQKSLKGKLPLLKINPTPQTFKLNSKALFKVFFKTLKLKALFQGGLRIKSLLTLNSNSLAHFTHLSHTPLFKFRNTQVMGSRFRLSLKKALLRNRTKLFKVRRNMRFKFLKKQKKSLFGTLQPLNLNTFLGRPRRWGRKNLRRFLLKQNTNLSITRLFWLKVLSWNSLTAPFSYKTAFSQNFKKNLWRKFLKWRKVKRLRKLFVQQKLLFRQFYSQSCILNQKVLKTKPKPNLLKLIGNFHQSLNILPTLLFNLNLLSRVSTNLRFTKSYQSPTKQLHLFSSFNLKFILPLYGFLFISSNNLFKHSRTTDQLAIKKTSHSFFYLNDLKSFITGKYSSVVNNYKFFFVDSLGSANSSTTLYTSNLYDKINPTMINFLTKSFTSVLNEAESSNFFQRHENDPRIPRFKFKPGYSRIWRRARAGVKEYFQLKFQYQHRLTRFLPQFYKLNRVSLIKSTELKIENLLLATHLIPDLLTCQEFLNAGLIFLNGRILFNGKVYALRNDLIQVLISIKYYILFKWLTNWGLVKQARLGRLLYLSRIQTKRVVRKVLPDWVLRKISYPYDVPKYVEVDYLTLSTFILYEPFLLNDFTHIFQKFSRSPIYNVYNWKYLT